jgi:hypothetical protein
MLTADPTKKSYAPGNIYECLISQWGHHQQVTYNLLVRNLTCLAPSVSELYSADYLATAGAKNRPNVFLGSRSKRKKLGERSSFWLVETPKF